MQKRISKNLTEILFHDLMIKDHESAVVQFPLIVQGDREAW